MVTHSCDVHIANRSLELDKRVSLVVEVRRAGLAARTEVRVVADSTLVTVTNNVCGLVGAKWSITVDAVVAGLCEMVLKMDFADWLVDGSKSVTGVDEGGIDNAVRAVVPVWAVKALVADTIDVLNAWSVSGFR